MVKQMHRFAYLCSEMSTGMKIKNNKRGLLDSGRNSEAQEWVYSGSSDRSEVNEIILFWLDFALKSGKSKVIINNFYVMKFLIFNIENNLAVKKGFSRKRYHSYFYLWFVLYFTQTLLKKKLSKKNQSPNVWNTNIDRWINSKHYKTSIKCHSGDQRVNPSPIPAWETRRLSVTEDSIASIPNCPERLHRVPWHSETSVRTESGYQIKNTKPLNSSVFILRLFSLFRILWAEI